jgi:hypothetical protein
MLAFSVPTIAVFRSDKPRFVPTFVSNSGFSGFDLCPILRFRSKFKCENPARNYPVAALPARAEMDNILLCNCINNYSLRYSVRRKLCELAEKTAKHRQNPHEY